MDGSLKARTIFEEAVPVPMDAAQSQKSEIRFQKPRAQPSNAQPHYGPWVPAHTPPPQDDRMAPPTRRVYQQRFDQEHIISMSKMSLFGLISGLMLLGILFFMIGFLVALGTLEPAKPTLAPQPTSWGDMSSHGATTSKAEHSQRGVFAKMAQQQIAGANAGAMKFVPKALQPLVRQEQVQGSVAVNGAIRGKPPQPQPKSAVPMQQPQSAAPQQPQLQAPAAVPMQPLQQQPIAPAPQQTQPQAAQPPAPPPYYPPPQYRSQ
ncbi:MAG: hypothetical protein WCG04_04665 [Alphaproteobacteria bacterium]